jgi:hypothetical protein
MERLGLFVKQLIISGEEICFDYNIDHSEQQYFRKEPNYRDYIVSVSRCNLPASCSNKYDNCQKDIYRLDIGVTAMSQDSKARRNPVTKEKELHNNILATILPGATLVAAPDSPKMEINMPSTRAKQNRSRRGSWTYEKEEKLIEVVNMLKPGWNLKAAIEGEQLFEKWLIKTLQNRATKLRERLEMKLSRSSTWAEQESDKLIELIEEHKDKRNI